MKKILALLMIALLGAAPEKVQASNSYWTQDEIKVEQRKEDQKSKIVLSTKEIEEEYGYLVIQGVIQKNQEELVGNKEFKGIWVECEVDTTAPFFMSISVKDKEGHQLSLREDAVFAQMKGTELELYSLEEGQYQISTSRKGEFFLPFVSFEDSKEFDWEGLSAYTISLVLPKMAETTMVLGETQIKTIEQPAFKEGAVFKVMGDSTLELPVHGESLGRYEMTQEGFSIHLLQEQEGVSFEDGILRISEQAKEGTIILEARNEEGVSLYKKVELKTPLRGRAEFLPAFPMPEEVKPIIIPAKELSQESILMWIRMGILGSMVVVVSAYAIYYPKAMRERRGE